MNRPSLIATILALTLTVPAFAGTNKDMVQLQTQIQQLQDAVARLQQSNDERMGVLKDLVQQSADSANRLSTNIDALQKQLAAQQTADGAKGDTVSGQVQALNDSLDEMKARMARLEKVLNDVQGQTQNISAAIQNGQAPANTIQPAAGQPSSPGQPASATPTTAVPQDTTAPPPAAQSLNAPPVPLGRPSSTTSAAPVDGLYRAAYNDYIAAKYPIATSEFLDVIKSYPDNTLAGNAYYYLGEIDYRGGKFAQATKDYDKVLEQFPDSNKTPAAHLHKGEALIQLHQNDAGVRELRALIQRFPVSPEATQARSKLNAMGVPVRPRA